MVALQLLDDMRQAGPEPDAFFCNSLLKAGYKKLFRPLKDFNLHDKAGSQRLSALDHR